MTTNGTPNAANHHCRQPSGVASKTTLYIGEHPDRPNSLFHADYHLLATHERAVKPGSRVTHLDHLPPEKVPGLTLNRQACQEEAAAIGPATSRVVQTLLDDPVLDRLPTVGRLLRLRQKYGEARLEAACRRALAFDDPAYKTIKGILKNGLEQQLPPEPTPAPAAKAFVRSALDLFGQALGGETWN